MKNSILKAASTLLASDGPSAVNFNTLALALKTNRAHIRYHYSSPQTLIRACFQELFLAGQKATIEELQKSKTLEAKVRAYVRGAFHWYSSDSKRMTLMLLLWFQTRLDPELRSFHQKFRDQGLSRIRLILLDAGWKASEARRRGRLIQNIITGAIASHATGDSHALNELMKDAELASLLLARRPGGR